MFNLHHLGAFHWNRIFMLLSMDKADSYWAYIDFPMLPKPIWLEKAARNFVLQFDPIATQVHTPLESSQVTINLFSDIYQSLVAELGTDQAEQFCNWGNQLNRLDRIERSIERIWYDIFRPLIREENHVFIKSLFTNQELASIQEIVTSHIDEIRHIDSQFESLEKIMPENSWEAEVLRIYNHEDAGNNRQESIDITPLDYLINWITFFKLRSVLREIRGIITTEEIHSLDVWIKSQKWWLENQSKPALYIKYMTLTEVFENIK
jgi:hypothetical protein